MRYLVTSAEMKEYDENTIERIGIPGMVLMERAALETFYALKEKGWALPGERVLVIAGHGNNGGDGLALARLLCEAGAEVFVLAVGEEAKATDQWKSQRRILESYPVCFVKEWQDKAYDLIIDALFGVGLSRELSGVYEAVIQKANDTPAVKVAMDVPSGLNCDDGRIMGCIFHADLTVTYGFEKRGLYLFPGCEAAGEVRPAKVGIDRHAFFDHAPSCFTLEESLEELLPKRKKNGNKGTFGKALILAGDLNMAGAAVLCARACYRLGAGMVKVLTHPENRVILQGALPEALLGPINDLSEIRKSLDWCDLVCIGPGLGRSAEVLAAFREILKAEMTVEKPLVIDADGLNLMTVEPDLMSTVKELGSKGRTILLTPHPGELKRIWEALHPQEKPISMEELTVSLSSRGMEVAEKLSVIVVAKDARTFVCKAGEPICMNLSGNSGMGTAGSGDVLAGIITAFLAQECHGETWNGKDAFLTACKAIRAHGLLGDKAAYLLGESSARQSEEHNANLQGKQSFNLLGEHGVMAGDLIP